MAFFIYEAGKVRKVTARKADRLGPKGYDAGTDAAIHGHFVLKAKDEADAAALAAEWLANIADEDATCDDYTLTSRGSPFGDGYVYVERF